LLYRVLLTRSTDFILFVEARQVMAIMTTKTGRLRRLLSPKEVQDLFGLSADLLRTISTTELPRYRFGHRTVRFEMEDVEQYLQRKRLT
jgi:hypothetical protein